MVGIIGWILILLSLWIWGIATIGKIADWVAIFTWFAAVIGGYLVGAERS